MKATVDADECVSCEVCEETCPAVFRIGDDVAEVIVDEIPPDQVGAAREAADLCPVEAIALSE